VRRAILLICICLAVGVTLTAVSVAFGQGVAPYAMRWWTADGGAYVVSGVSPSGKGYTMTTTIGQPDAGLMSGGKYTLGGGYWGTALRPTLRLYLPLVRRSGL
jgi:hypothetical protein